MVAHAERSLTRSSPASLPNDWLPLPRSRVKGNVGQLIDIDDPNNPTVANKYEYDAYGNTLVATEAYAANPFRFSTKWRDEPVTGHELYYYGYRYYSPRLGRWLSRDPIEEEGGANLLTFVGNQPTVGIDALGTWGADVHYAKTRDWALNEVGMLSEYADVLATACNGVDPPTWQWPFSTSGDNLSWHFDIPAGSILVWGPYDSRWVHAMKQIQTAVTKCNNNNNIAFVVAKELGRGLHPVQDWVAHGTWDPTYGTVTNWRRHAKEADWWGYDYARSSDGIPRDDLRKTVTTWEALRGWSDAANYVSGPKRQWLTKQRTIAYLFTFRSRLHRNTCCYKALFGQ
jgi:RHS repeat-associated protein